MRLLCWALLVWVLPSPFGISTLRAASDLDELLRSADEVVAQLAKLRGMPAKAPIAKGVRSRAEIRTYLLERLEAEYPPSEVEVEARLLKRLGVIPDDLDLYSFMVDMLTEQIAGYYDPFDEVFYVADWVPPVLQRPVMIHELTHALQDQYFDLDRFMTRVEDNDDRTTARTAVFEGEALLAMLVSVMPGRLDPKHLPDPVELHLAQLPLMEAEYPIFASAPQYLKLSMLFPYAWGARFILAFLRENPWSEIGGLYERMPESTEQILHPEKYFGEPDPPTPVDLDDYNRWPPGFDRIVYSNVLGEFALRQVLAQHLAADLAERAAAGWDGDRLELRQHESGAEALLFWSVWDSMDDAGEFALAWRQAADRRLGPGTWDCTETGDCRRQVGEHGWEIRRHGDRVAVIEVH